MDEYLENLNEVDKYASGIIENTISIIYSKENRIIFKEELKNKFVPKVLTESQFERGYRYLEVHHRFSKYPARYPNYER